MRFTAQEHRKFADLMDQGARRKWLSQEQREEYLFKANRFRHLARLASKRAKENQPKT